MIEPQADDRPIPSGTTIRAMNPADIEAAADLLRREGWGERLEFFQSVLGWPAVHTFVADRDGAVIGTGVASTHGSVGWVGTIFVDSAYRRVGLGGALTRVVIEDLEARGCETLALIATPMGRPVYEREGFRVVDNHVRLSAEGRPEDDPPDPRLRPYAEADRAAILDLDAYATGEDRAGTLGSLLSPESTTVAHGSWRPGRRVPCPGAVARWRDHRA